jgi:hypothetical protein
MYFLADLRWIDSPRKTSQYASFPFDTWFRSGEVEQATNAAAVANRLLDRLTSISCSALT